MICYRNDVQHRNFPTEYENFNGIEDLINLCKIIDSTLNSISVTSIEFVIFRLNFHKININDFMTDFLNSAIFHNSLSSLKHLLRNYCTQNLNEYNVYKRLNRSAMLCIEYKKPECLRQLLLYGTLVDNRQVQARFPACSTSSHSLIHKFVNYISPHGDIEENIINTLYQFGINLYEKNDSGQTALQVLQTTPHSAVLYNEALEENRQNLSDKLQDMMSEPLTLLGLSRLAVLRSMGRNYIGKVEQLSPLPRSIMRYLRFEELQIDLESGFDSESEVDDSIIESEYTWNQIDNSEEDNDSNYTDFNEENNSINESDDTEDYINNENISIEESNSEINFIDELVQEFNFNENTNSINSSKNEIESNFSSENEYEFTISIEQESHISYPHQLNETTSDDESSTNENQIYSIDGERSIIEFDDQVEPTTIYFHDELYVNGRGTGVRTTSSFPLAEILAFLPPEQE